MGFFYEDGGPVRRSSKKAFEWFMKAAEQGSSWGQYLVAECYGSGLGVRKSLRKAVEWYKKAAEQGDEDSMYLLGWHYCMGYGVKQNDEEGYKWFEKAGCHSTVEALRKSEGNRGGWEVYTGDGSDAAPFTPR